MGYYADGHGWVRVKEKESGNAVADELAYRYTINDRALDIISFDEYGKYYETEVLNTLNAIVPYISEGEVEYAGEDNEYWRFILKNGKWKYQSGHIAYDEVEGDLDGKAMTIKLRYGDSYRLIDGKITHIDEDRITIDTDKIAMKIWSVEDVEACLKEDGYESSEDNVNKVLNTHMLDALEDCTDWDWEIIHQAIDEAKIEKEEKHMKMELSLTVDFGAMESDPESVKRWVRECLSWKDGCRVMVSDVEAERKEGE